MAPAKFVALQVTPEAREAARRMSALIAGETEQRVTYAQVLQIAEALMRTHRSELADHARPFLTTEGDSPS